MQIVVEINKYIDYYPTDDEPTEEDLISLNFKQDASGQWLKRQLIETNTETTIGLPETQIETLKEHFERVGTPKSNKEIIAWILEDKIMPHHAPRHAWVRIKVPKDPDLQNYLNYRFELNGE